MATEFELVGKGARIAAMTPESIKTFKGKSQPAMTTLFVPKSGRDARVGLGVYLPEESNYYGTILPEPVRVVQALRATEILHYVPKISVFTFGDVYLAAGKDGPPDYEMEAVRRLEHTLGEAGFNRLRAKAFNQTSYDDVLGGMLPNLNTAGVIVDIDELRAEVKRGRISRLPIVRDMIAEKEQQ